jgi:ABC-type dipeptide/oligopeptide/nickel transport system permease subunit
MPHPDEPPPPARVPSGLSLWRIGLRRLRLNRAALAALVFLGLLAAMALAAPLIAPCRFDKQFRGAEATAPFERVVLPASPEREAVNHFFFLGSDHHARDTWARIVYGARVSLVVGFLATFISLVLGVSSGLVSGYFGGWPDALLMRLTDTVFAFPSVLLAVAITAVADRPSLWVVFLALGMVGWTSLARVVRAQVLSLKSLDYLVAARALGTGHLRVILRHILPNCLGPITVVATLSVGGNLLGEAGLSFLGLGVQEPYPSWGQMLSEAAEHYTESWWLGVFPGLAIVLTVLSFNLLGDGLRDALDPRTDLGPMVAGAKAGR